MDKRSPAGQSLVELALVLPCFCLGVFLGVHLIVYGHNMIELQRMAQLAADHARGGTPRSVIDYRWFHGLWGRTAVLPVQQTTSHSLRWRRHRGVSTLRQAGSFAHIRVGAVHPPGTGFSRAFLPVRQYAFAPTHVEPAALKEKQ